MNCALPIPTSSKSSLQEPVNRVVEGVRARRLRNYEFRAISFAGVVRPGYGRNPLYSQNPGALDPSFTPLILSSRARFAIQSDGAVLLVGVGGGSFIQRLPRSGSVPIAFASSIVAWHEDEFCEYNPEYSARYLCGRGLVRTQSCQPACGVDHALMHLVYVQQVPQRPKRSAVRRSG